MMSVRERAAKALAEYFDFPDDWEPYLEQVDIVLQAIREPTAEMAVAGASVMSAVIPENVPISSPVAIAQPKDVFIAMIDRALREADE